MIFFFNIIMKPKNINFLNDTLWLPDITLTDQLLDDT